MHPLDAPLSHFGLGSDTQKHGRFERLTMTQDNSNAKLPFWIKTFINLTLSTFFVNIVLFIAVAISKSSFIAILWAVTAFLFLLFVFLFICSCLPIILNEAQRILKFYFTASHKDRK